MRYVYKFYFRQIFNLLPTNLGGNVWTSVLKKTSCHLILVKLFVCHAKHIEVI
jgi:hypothetical protein